MDSMTNSEQSIANRKTRPLSLCLAGTHSGCGKTTFSLGLMAALIERGLAVQPFKVGPDFIDPGHHRRITGRDSHNLDGWIMNPGQNREIFARYTHDADAAVVEGVMGLFDGFSGAEESGSTAQMAKWLGLPVVLVIDARSMARSAAALALGFSRFERALPLRGVVFNRVGSPGHARMLREAMAAVPELTVFGCLPREADLEIPARHLGLVTDEDLRPADQEIARLGQWVAQNLDLDLLLSAAEETGAGEIPLEPPPAATPVRIAVARDEAFCFYYGENLRLLSEAGALLVPFSPIRSRHLPEGIKGLILGGGYPELHCRALAENHTMRDSVRAFARDGGPIYAECGGFMYLTEKIRDLEGTAYPMAGVFPFASRMEPRLKSLGYREAVTRAGTILGPAGTRVRGHEFHYSHIEGLAQGADCVYSLTDRRASGPREEGFLTGRVLGSYVHLHWGSNPGVARNFVDYCRQWGP